MSFHWFTFSWQSYIITGVEIILDIILSAQLGAPGKPLTLPNGKSVYDKWPVKILWYMYMIDSNIPSLAC